MSISATLYSAESSSTPAIEALRARKKFMNENQYYAQLEKILVELAHVYAGDAPTSAPAAANSRVMARPKPRFPPVTRALSPVKWNGETGAATAEPTSPEAVETCSPERTRLTVAGTA